MVKEIIAQNDLIIFVDDDIYEKIKDFYWTVASVNNASRLRVYNRKLGCLTKFVIGSNDKNLKVTFKDNNPLNLQRSNLMIVSPSEISRKTKGRRNTSSKYKGVCWNKRLAKWHSRLGINQSSIHLGFFEDEDEAARAYNRAAIKHFGEGCYLNKIGYDNSADTIEIEKDFQGRSTNSSGYRGVYQDGKKWSARILSRENTLHLGIFSTKEDTAKTYDKKAYELFGEKAILNFPVEVRL